MSQLKTLEVIGRAFGDQAASQSSDFVRLGEFSGTLAGKANTVHRHDASDIDDLIPLMFELMMDMLAPSSSVQWQVSGTQTMAQVRLRVNGGLLLANDGLYVDSGTVSVPGHHHVTADINDFSTALYSQLETLFAVSPTIAWAFVGNEVSGTVVLQPASGILATPNGLACDFGSGTNQVARGSHSHSQLHNPLTIVEGDSIALSLAGQELAAEVQLAPQSGLQIVSGGLELNFGSGTGQAAEGNHSHALLHQPVTIVSTDSALTLSISTQQQLSGTVNLDPNPAGGLGLLAKGSAGLSVVLGSGSNTAAPGNHGHSVATESLPGFMSATDKTRLDTLWTDSGTGSLPPSGTMDSLNVRVLYLVNVHTGRAKAIWLDDNNVVHIGSGTLLNY